MNWYSRAFDAAFDKEIDLLSDVLKVALLASTYTPDLDDHDYWDDVSAHQITGTGYTAGGNVLTSVAWEWVSASSRWRLTGANSQWTVATFTARYAVLYDDSPGTAATKPLLGLLNMETDRSPAGETFTIDWNDTTGLLYIDVTFT